MTERLKTILDEIYSGKRKSVNNLNLTLEELLTKDNNGITFLEHLLKNDIFLYSLESIYKNNAEAAYLYVKYNKSLISFNLSEDNLFSYINGERLIDYLCKNNKIQTHMYKAVKEHTELMDIIISVVENNNKRAFWLAELSPELARKYFTKDENGDYYVDKYWDNKDAMKLIVEALDKFEPLILLCEKHNDFEVMENVNKELLMTNYKDATVLDFLVKEKNIIPKVLENINEDLVFVKFLIEHNYFEYLEKAREFVQLLKVEGDKTLLDILIEKGYTPKISYISKKETINKLLDNNITPDVKCNSNYDVLEALYERQRPDLLAKCDIKTLLENDKFFNYILSSIKEGKRISIPRINTNDINLRIKYYITIAKEDLEDYIVDLKEEDLLRKYNDKTLLEHLLDADFNITVDKLLTNKTKENNNIAVILKAKGYKQDNINVIDEKEAFNDEYMKQDKLIFGMGPIQEEGAMLLIKLYDLFINDNNSDKDLINALISGYKESLIKNYNATIKELKNLIKVKENNEYFYYIKQDVHPYFSGRANAIFCNLPVISTIMHETAHALHYYLTDEKIPENYEEIVERARQNPKLLKTTENFVSYVKSIKETVKKQVEIKCEDYFKGYFTNERIEEIKEKLSKAKEEQKIEYMNLGIPEDILDNFLDEKFTVEEYIANIKRIYIREINIAILDTNYNNFCSICDILDAIYDGKLFSGKLKNNEGEVIERSPGHGLCYFYGTNLGFHEMVAEFSELMKHPNSKENLDLLRSVVGDEVYNMISDFYYQNIINSDKYSESKKEGMQI